MGLSLEGRFVRCAYGANETQHRNRKDLELAQSLNKAFGKGIDFQYALDEFPVCRPTMKVSIRAEHGPNIFWRV